MDAQKPMLPPVKPAACKSYKCSQSKYDVPKLSNRLLISGFSGSGKSSLLLGALLGNMHSEGEEAVTLRGAVAYGDGNVSRGCAARMLQLHERVRERGVAEGEEGRGGVVRQKLRVGLVESPVPEVQLARRQARGLVPPLLPAGLRRRLGRLG